MSSIASRIRRHLADLQLHHRRIATGSLWVNLFILIDKLAGAANAMTTAWRCGVSKTLDANVRIQFDQSHSATLAQGAYLKVRNGH